MDGIGLIQDLAIVLLAAGLAGSLCRRIGLSVIVGYLLAGVIVGPYTPPFSWILDVGRIEALSQVGMVFLMFGIGLGLSVSRLARMGAPTLVATALGAFFMLNLTKVLGYFVGWTGEQSLYLAAMFMVSSSAVIAKVVEELGLSHEKAAQHALSITVLEDVVAVTMLTVLASRTGAQGSSIGALLAGLTAFVVLLVGAGLLMVPKLMRRLEARADPELQTIIVAGILFLLALAAVKAGYSLALGAFLLGAIVAELPQKTGVQKAFNGMRDLFSSVFFVSIGMMIDIRLLIDVWGWILGLTVFVLVARTAGTTLALTLSGTKPAEARRAGLLLTPLGEFSFIIAQLGVSSGVLPKTYYPLAVGVSILTVFLMPLINRFSTPILEFGERAEPGWLRGAFEAYHGWLDQLQSAPTRSGSWKLIRGRLGQIALETAFVTGLLIFSGQLLELLQDEAGAFSLEAENVGYVFWAVVTLVALVPLVAIWRNINAIAMIYAENVSASRVPYALVQNTIKGTAAVVMAYWLYLILPIHQFGPLGWVLIGVFAILVIAFYSRRLIYWHSEWQTSVREVLEQPAETDPEAQRLQRLEGLDSWNVRLVECVVPDSAPYSGQTLAELAIPSRFGCVVLELERNGMVITAIGPDLRVYPGDKLLLLGGERQTRDALAGLSQSRKAEGDDEAFRGSVLETLHLPPGPWSGQTLAQLNIGRLTGTRIAGIRRGKTTIISPSGQERLESGDDLLVAGTLAEIAAFRRWLKSQQPVAASA
ncbi:sodium:proton exchanger [Opitutaceae bacterium EW11]|nr:sodium:proton exchanger [Opitutaceae bacterium EW11]